MAAALVAAAIIFVTGPSAPRHTSPVSSSLPTLRGAFHIHTTRSDGALDKAAVARQARSAGLQFAILTDHGDATTTPDPPEYIDGVLCVDAVEISTNGGHYIALGLPAAPYRLGGDADGVVEDVARLGGFGVAAHPTSLHAELAWSAWEAPIDALEWLNADSEWRDEGRFRLTRTLIDYFWRPAGALASLLDRPVSALTRWDELAADRRVFALAGHDAHGGVGAETSGAPGRRFHLPSYEAAFRTFSVNVFLSRALTGNPQDDARELLSAIRQGHIFTVVDAVASPGAAEFTASAGAAKVMSGEVLPVELGRARLALKGQFPPGARIILLRNGRAIAETAEPVLDHEVSGAGAYRVEVRVDGAPGTPPVPWLVTNPIFRFAAKPEPQTGARISTTVSELTAIPWRAEVGEGSSGKVSMNAGAVTLDYRLKPGDEANQFAALAGDLHPAPDATIVSFVGQADKPMRLSVQLRFAQADGARWRKSTYLDAEPREVVIPVEQLRPADRQTARPPIERATSLLFVVDLTNASPGTQGRFAVRDVKLSK